MTTRRDFLGRCAAALAVVAGVPSLPKAERRRTIISVDSPGEYGPMGDWNEMMTRQLALNAEWGKALADYRQWASQPTPLLAQLPRAKP